MKEEALDPTLLRTCFGKDCEDDDDDDKVTTKRILKSMISFGELVTLRVRQLTENLIYFHCSLGRYVVALPTF